MRKTSSRSVVIMATVFPPNAAALSLVLFERKGRPCFHAAFNATKLIENRPLFAVSVLRCNFKLEVKATSNRNVITLTILST